MAAVVLGRAERQLGGGSCGRGSCSVRAILTAPEFTCQHGREGSAGVPGLPRVRPGVGHRATSRSCGRSPAQDARVAAITRPAEIPILARELGRSVVAVHRRQMELRQRGRAA